MATSVDERGRVLVPKGLREQFGLEPGAPVIIEADADGVKLRRAISRKIALERLAGVIPKSRASRGSVDTKRIWEIDP